MTLSYFPYSLISSLFTMPQCNYRVINHIKRSCSDMAEEELNKMAVHLLNCQLQIENRPTFECEDSMSIGKSWWDADFRMTQLPRRGENNVPFSSSFLRPNLPFPNSGECTSQMDATQWNSYQIVANRARAVCYATRQQIFRIKTEAAVNRLVQTSHDQITGMEKLREDQQMLGQVRVE